MDWFNWGFDLACDYNLAEEYSGYYDLLLNLGEAPDKACDGALFILDIFDEEDYWDNLIEM